MRSSRHFGIVEKHVWGRGAAPRLGSAAKLFLPHSKGSCSSLLPLPGAEGDRGVFHQVTAATTIKVFVVLILRLFCFD